MRQAALLALAVVALLALPVGASAASAPSAPSSAGAPTASATVIGVHVKSSGDARWTVSVRYQLNDSTDRRAFDRLATRFDAGQGTPSMAAFRAAARTASNRTGRPMRVTNPTQRSDVQNRSDGTAVGTLTLAFTWTNFANTTGERISIRDAFAGGWLGSLYGDQTLRVYPPDGYRTDSVSPRYQKVNGVLTWRGPQSFPAGGPDIVLVKSAGTPWLLVGALVAAALVVGVVAAYAWRGFGGRGHLDVGSRGDEGGGGANAATNDGGGPETGGTRGGESSPPSGADDGGGTRGGEQAQAAEELLSDEERVERLLRENGGRMKQANIVSETRWSDAKVSQLLSSMADEGRVEKLRIGRENLISFPDEDEE